MNSLSQLAVGIDGERAVTDSLMLAGRKIFVLARHKYDRWPDFPVAPLVLVAYLFRGDSFVCPTVCAVAILAGRLRRNTMMNATGKTKVEVYELFMLGLCIYVLSSLAVTTFLQVDPSVDAILESVDGLICFVFMEDFFVKL